MEISHGFWTSSAASGGAHAHHGAARAAPQGAPEGAAAAQGGGAAAVSSEAVGDFMGQPVEFPWENHGKFWKIMENGDLYGDFS